MNPNATQSPTASLPRDPASTEIRWDGHMTDGIGATYGDKPLAFLSATTDELQLVGNRGNFRIPRAAVRKLGRGNLYPWCFAGVRIHHGVSHYPAELQFKPMDARSRDILDRLRTLGYPVS